MASSLAPVGVQTLKAMKHRSFKWCSNNCHVLCLEGCTAAAPNKLGSLGNSAMVCLRNLLACRRSWQSWLLAKPRIKLLLSRRQRSWRRRMPSCRPSWRLWARRRRPVLRKWSGCRCGCGGAVEQVDVLGIVVLPWLLGVVFVRTAAWALAPAWHANHGMAPISPVRCFTSHCHPFPSSRSPGWPPLGCPRRCGWHEREKGHSRQG